MCFLNKQFKKIRIGPVFQARAGTITNLMWPYVNEYTGRQFMADCSVTIFWTLYSLVSKSLTSYDPVDYLYHS